MPTSTLLILYNASGTLLGHLTYGYHHLRQTAGRDCSACALTHGPSLTLSARQEWTELKARIERGGLGGMAGHGIPVRELHIEDLSPAVKSYLDEESLGLPCVLLEAGGLRTVLTKHELDDLGGDLSRFRDALRAKFGALLSPAQ